MGHALFGRRERLAGAFRLGFGDVSHIEEQGQRRIDHAWARHVAAARQILDRANELVAVARLIGDQLEQDEPEFSRIEDATASAATLARLAFPASAAMAETMPAEVMAMPMPAVVMMIVMVKGSHRLHLFMSEHV